MEWKEIVQWCSSARTRPPAAQAHLLLLHAVVVVTKSRPPHVGHCCSSSVLFNCDIIMIFAVCRCRAPWERPPHPRDYIRWCLAGRTVAQRFTAKVWWRTAPAAWFWLFKFCSSSYWPRFWRRQWCSRPNCRRVRLPFGRTHASSPRRGVGDRHPPRVRTDVRFVPIADILQFSLENKKPPASLAGGNWHFKCRGVPRIRTRN